MQPATPMAAWTTFRADTSMARTLFSPTARFISCEVFPLIWAKENTRPAASSFKRWERSPAPSRFPPIGSNDFSGLLLLRLRNDWRSPGGHGDARDFLASQLPQGAAAGRRRQIGRPLD